jgi:hypothetical protein
MTGIAILDVALGLVSIYLLLSLLCTAVTEWIAQGTRLRARTLKAGIEQLLADTKFRRVSEELYKHPLIAGLTQGERDPSYISGPLFAKAFLAQTEKKLAAIGADLSAGSFLANIDRIFEKYDQIKMEIYRKGQIVAQRVSEAEQVLEQLHQRERTLRKSGATAGELATAEHQLVTGEDVVKNAKREQDDYAKDYLGYAGTLDQKMGQLEAEQVCYRHVAEVLKSFITAESATIGDLEAFLARWYEQAMGRVSGWYRRRIAAIALGVAAATALLFNADTLGMARNIWLDNEIRDVIRRAADSTAGRCTPAEIRAGDRPGCSVEELIKTIDARRRLPLGWYADAMPLARNFCPEGAPLRHTRDEARRVAADGARPVAERAEADLRATRAEAQFAVACGPRVMDYLLWLFGIGLSIAAFALFALIWFDVLKRFVTLRSAGHPPPREAG